MKLREGSLTALACGCVARCWEVTCDGAEEAECGRVALVLVDHPLGGGHGHGDGEGDRLVELAPPGSASKISIRRFVITEKAPTRAFSWLKAATTAFTFKTLLRHYAKRALIPRSLNMKLGLRRNYHKGRVAIRHYADQPNPISCILS